MSTSRKKVIVRGTSGDFLPGYLAVGNFLIPGNASTSPSAAPYKSEKYLDLLDLEGRSMPFPLDQVKLVCFVRDFNREDKENPERLTRRAFLSRPRTQGLWLRITFIDGEQLEGLAPQDHTLLDALVDDAGLFLTPPDERANTHRIYIPRVSVVRLELLAVVQAPARNKTGGRTADPSQPTLFPS